MGDRPTPKSTTGVEILITTDKHPATNGHGEALMQALMPRIGLCYTNVVTMTAGPVPIAMSVACLPTFVIARRWNTISWPLRLVPLLNAAISASMDDLRYVSAHRWRYARVANPLGQRFLHSANATPYIGGAGASVPVLRRRGPVVTPLPTTFWR